MNKEDLIAPDKYNIVDEIEKHVQESKKLALIYVDDTTRRTMTYASLLENVNKTANVLKTYGMKKGDKVLIMVPRLIESYEVYLAALKLGIIIIPSSEMLRTEDLQYRITNGEVDGIISYADYVEVYKGIDQYEELTKFTLGKAVDGWHHIDALKERASSDVTVEPTSKDDIAFLPYTSGTTGNPKGVVHTHGWGYAHLRTVATNWLDIKDTDVVWATASPGWQKWVWSPLLSILGSGATGFVFNGRFQPDSYLKFIQKEEINVLCCTPTEYRMMAITDNLESFHLESLRSAVSAGEPLNREVIDIFQKHFNLSVRDGYGQTESTLLLGIMKDMEIKPGSMGKPTPGNDVIIIDEAGKEVAVHEVGDIAVALDCPALFKEYYRDEAKKQGAIRGNYFVTGDRASRDEDGYFWFEGRDDDIIISSGYTIGPFEVEDVLVKHPAVKECAIVGSPHALRGQVVKAFVVLRDGFEPRDTLVKELQQFSKQHTAPYKYPREIEFIDALPKTTSGKTRRVALRELEIERKKK